MRRVVFTLAAVLNLLLADQVSKEAAIALLKGKAPFAVLPFFNLAYVENRGCAWGLFQGQVWPLAVFGLAALAFILVKRRAVFPSGWVGAVSETLLYAGIVGNLIDRFARGFVVDFFDFHLAAHHFPCFNAADSFITVAAALLIADGLFRGKSAEKPLEKKS